MTINKQLESEVIQFLEDYWRIYIEGDITTWSKFLSDDYKNIGTNEEEVWHNKKEIVNYSLAMLDQLAGNLQLKNKQVQVYSLDPYIQTHEFADMYIKTDKDWVFYAKLRLSSIIQQTENGFLMLHQHGSFPDAKTDAGEFLAIEDISRENAELRDAIKRRTSELELKNRELEIEVALEKVRARTMAMHKSDELHDVAEVLFQQLRNFGGDLWGSGIGLCTSESEEDSFWFVNENGILPTVTIPHTIDPTHRKMFEGWQKKESLVIETKEGKELLAHYAYMLSLPSVKGFFQGILDAGLTFPTWQRWHAAYFTHGYLLLITTSPYPHAQLLVRFAKVFEQAYVRFLDLQKAEIQTREAQIQLSLERVRARSMAMHSSEELNEVLSILFQQFDVLGITPINVWLSLLDEEKGTFTYRSTGTSGSRTFTQQVIAFNAMDIWQEVLDQWKSGTVEPVLVTHYPAERLPELFEVFKETFMAMPEKERINITAFPNGFYNIQGYCRFGYIGYNHINPPSEEQKDLVTKFAREFERVYQRFLDIQKAEVQAREAQIEAALEKVRSRSLAMHRSNELNEVVGILFEKLKELQIPATAVGLGIAIEGSKDLDAYVCGENEAGLVITNYRLPFFDNIISKDLINTLEKQLDYFVGKYSKEEKNSFYNYLFEHSAIKDVPDDIKSMIFESPTYTISMVAVKNTVFNVNDFEGNVLAKNEVDIIKRFAKVFEQAYIRFLDLQKAETQAREAQIENAIEKIRSKTMAMQRSDELTETSYLLDQQVRALGIKTWGCAFSIYRENDSIEWFGNEAGILPTYTVPREGIFKEYYQLGQKGESLYVKEFSGQECIDHYEFMSTLPVLGDVLRKLKETNGSYPDYQIDHVVFFKYGYLLFVTIEHVPESYEIFKRFAKVFEQTYTRFLDLQKSEEQAEESKVQLALERVRARTMAMHQSKELAETAAVVFQQMTELGVTPERINICLIKEDINTLEVWSTDQNGISISHHFNASLDEPTTGQRVYKAWKENKKSLVIDLSGAELNDWVRYVREVMGMTIKDELLKDHRIHSVAFFSHGMLLTTTHYPLPEKSMDLLCRFADVFNLTYTRFLDLQKAEAQAREAEIELALERVRSQAMAMQKSSDLLDIVVTMRNEFTRLGHEAHYFWHMMWLPEKYEKAMTSGDGTRIGMVMELPRHMHGDIPLLSRWENSKEPTVVYPMDAEAAINYVDKMIALGDFKQVDPNAPNHDDIRHIGGLTFIMARTTHGEIGYSLPGVVKHPPKEDLDILVRLAGAFDIAHQRFLDLQKSESQSKEVEIELALEKVRSRSMGMQKSEELKEVIKLVYLQLTNLKINLDHVGFVVDYTLKGDWHFWIADEVDIPSKITHPYFDSVWANQFNEAKENGAELFTTILNFEEKNKFYEELLSYVPELPESSKEFYLTCPGLAATTVLYDDISLYVENFTGDPYTEEENKILLRFGKVFQQTYTRFLDLQKAEAQAREAQIEVAMERVRARAMAMHHTDELTDVLCVLFDQFDFLGINPVLTHLTLFDEENETFTLRITTSGDKRIVADQVIDINAVESWKTSFANWKQSELHAIDCIDYPPEVIPFIFELMDEVMSVLPEGHKIVAEDFPDGLYTTQGHCKFGYIGFNHIRRATEEEKQIVIRIAKEFGRLYQRFLDIRKAEAQSREAQIEAALEKVRSQSLAMHSSNEMQLVANEVSNQLKGLGLELDAVGMSGAIHLEEGYDVWLGSTKATKPLRIPFNDDTQVQRDYNELLKKRPPLFSKTYSGKVKKEYIDKLISHGEFPDELKNKMVNSSAFSTTIAPTKNSGIQIVRYTSEPYTEEENEIVIRFAKVFEQAYIRFLDLQKAEAQAREAQIETALERVRAQTMAMNKSQDLQQAVAVIFKELDKLDLKTMRCGIGMINEENRTANVWTTTATEDGEIVSFHGNESMDVHPVLQGAFASWQKQEDFYYELIGDDLINYYKTMGGDNYRLPDSASGSKVSTTDRHYYYCTFFSAGGLYFFSEYPFTQELTRTIRRFANAFSLSYKRFEDLKLSEQQAYKAQIEFALERVRARALAMQAPEELLEVAQVLRREMGLLGVEELETASIFIHDEDYGKTECWYALKDVREEKSALVSDHFALNLSDTWVGREMIRFYEQDNVRTSIVMQGKNRIEWIRYCEEKSAPFKGYYGEIIPDRTYHLYKFSDGAIGAAAPGEISEESWELLRRAASVFSLAYSRFKDLTQARVDLLQLKTEKQRAEEALTNLKAAQSQLVQAEKMASLGELTAGIAHEIQNPLNFVNNFSEVSNELIVEMREELDKGDIEEAKSIATDIEKNLHKINHHGKRADGIVKGMLQHSRRGSGDKEPTDINALADEYFRLAYHGLRAKDQTFNAVMETDFDDSIPLIKIVPQDIGRVILNIITNAFWAVNEKSKTKDSTYKPTVTISSEKKNGHVAIQISDNGNGIPDEVLSKIFQPFFTTKPTGQGTGLGLSLSYDIIKAHGGEIQVQSRENQGTTFIITLNQTQK